MNQGLNVARIRFAQASKRPLACDGSGRTVSPT